MQFERLKNFINLNDNFEITDFNQKIQNLDILSFCLSFNRLYNLKLNENQWEYLIKKSNLDLKNEQGLTPLMYILAYNNYEKFNFSKDLLNYLIENSNLNSEDIYGKNALIYSFYSNLDIELLNKIYSKTILTDKQKELINKWQEREILLWDNYNKFINNKKLKL